MLFIYSSATCGNVISRNWQVFVSVLRRNKNKLKIDNEIRVLWISQNWDFTMNNQKYVFGITFMIVFFFFFFLNRVCVRSFTPFNGWLLLCQKKKKSLIRSRAVGCELSWWAVRSFWRNDCVVCMKKSINLKQKKTSAKNVRWPLSKYKMCRMISIFLNDLPNSENKTNFTVI